MQVCFEVYIKLLIGGDMHEVNLKYFVGGLLFFQICFVCSVLEKFSDIDLNKNKHGRTKRQTDDNLS